MAHLALLRANLSAKRDTVARSTASLAAIPPEGVTSLANRLAKEEFVLFCGAGISVPAPSSAPQFLEIRDAVALAMADLLLSRDVLQRTHHEALEAALRDLQRRDDLTLPPELLFGNLERSLGFAAVADLLSLSLGGDVPNANHLAVRTLAERGRLAGVITPNFDLYLEQALEGIPLRRSVAGEKAISGEQGFVLYKPHGSLDVPESIAITINRVARPLAGPAREIFRELVTHRTVVVIGYSGWDYELLPLLAHAGTEWGAEIVWCLWDDASLNERVITLKVTLGDRCTVINGNRQALLAALAGVKPPSPPQSRNLRELFSQRLAAHASHELAEALISVSAPSGVMDEIGLEQQLAMHLLQYAEGAAAIDDHRRLRYLRTGSAHASDRAARQRAIEGALKLARRMGNEAAVRDIEAERAGEYEDANDSRVRLRTLDREIAEFPFSIESETNPERARRSLLTDLRIEKAARLAELRRTQDAKALAEQILADTSFPTSGVSEDAWIVTDAAARWQLHDILGTIAAEGGDLAGAERHYCAAIDLLWNERELWDLGQALLQTAGAVRRHDADTARVAMALAREIAKVAHDKSSELQALEWTLEFGLGTPDDVHDAKSLLAQMHIDDADRASHVEILERQHRRMRLRESP